MDQSTIEPSQGFNGQKKTHSEEPELSKKVSLPPGFKITASFMKSQIVHFPVTGYKSAQLALWSAL